MYLIYGLFLLTIILAIFINRSAVRKMNKINEIKDDRLRNRYRRKNRRPSGK